MQPYLLPYIGYYQLLSCCDLYVVLDDVRYSKRKWVRSNYIVEKNARAPFSIPLVSPSSATLISDLLVSEVNYIQARKSLIHRLKTTYNDNTEELFKLVSHTFVDHPHKLIDITIPSLNFVNNEYDLGCEIVRSHDIRNQIPGFGEDYVVNLCSYLKADCYVNLPGGKELYDKQLFARSGIELKFIEMLESQKHEYFFDQQPMSILDSVSKSGFERLKRSIRSYQLS